MSRYMGSLGENFNTELTKNPMVYPEIGTDLPHLEPLRHQRVTCCPGLYGILMLLSLGLDPSGLLELGWQTREGKPLPLGKGLHAEGHLQRSGCQRHSLQDQGLSRDLYMFI